MAMPNFYEYEGSRQGFLNDVNNVDSGEKAYEQLQIMLRANDITMSDVSLWDDQGVVALTMRTKETNFHMVTNLIWQQATIWKSLSWDSVSLRYCFYK